jgi:hypothetical protein
MNRRHRKTIEAILAVPTRSGIKFADIERLFVSLGAEIVEGCGSRVAFVMRSGIKWEAHRPHPQKEAKKYQIEALREFLISIGVESDE